MKPKQKKRPNPVTRPITPQRLRKETRAATNLEFRPLERKIAAEGRASDQRVKDVGGWFNEYLQEVSGLRADTANAYAQAGAQTQGMISQASAVDSANSQRLNTEESEAAALRGQAASGAAPQREAAAQAQRNYLSSALGGSIATQGANQYAYLSDKQRIGAGQKIAARREEQKRGLGIREDQREVAKQRGDYATTYRGDLRQKERDYLIQQRAFPQKNKELALDAKEGAYDRALQERTQSETERHNRASEQNSREDNQGGGGERQEEKKENRAARKEAWSAAVSLFEKRKWPSWAALETRLRKESEVTPSAARWAIQRLKKRAEKEERQQDGKEHGWTD